MVDPSLLILVAVIVFGGIAVVVKAASNARAERMRETCFDFANTQGFTYYAQGYPNKIYDPGPFFGLFDSAPADPLLLQLQPFEPFTRGTNRRLTDLLVARRERSDCYLFQYRYTISTGKSSTTFTCSVSALRVSMILPSLRIGPENVFTRIGEHLGMQDIKFEMEEFNRRYVVQCDDEKKAYDLLDPKVIEYLMSLPVRDWQMGGWWLVSVRDRPFDPFDAFDMAQAMEGFVERLPHYVAQDASFAATWDSPLTLA